MKNSTPFFPGFNRILFGSPPRSARKKLEEELEALQQASLCQLAKLFESWIPAAELAPKPGQRRRRYPTAVTFWAFLSQTIDPGSPCRETVRKIQAWCTSHKLELPDTNTGGYCKARNRLDGRRLRKLHRLVAQRLERDVHKEQLWEGHRVKVVDGTGVSMPDTPANQRAFPQPSNQKQGCGFPVAKLVGCFCLSSGALLDWAEGPLRSSEHTLFRKLWSRFDTGDVFLADRGFCSYEAIATLLERGVHSVLRLHQARPTVRNPGGLIDKNQWMSCWEKPSRCPKETSPEEWENVPESMQLRHVRIRVTTPGFRTREVIIVTTLLDHKRYTAESLGELYFRRWSVELFFRDIKITLGMDVLRCQSPEMVRKEIIMHAIAYNLIRALMQQAAQRYKVDLSRVSFKGAVDTLRQWGAALESLAKKPREVARATALLLELIAQDLNPLRPGRTEPRAKKRRPKNYHLLTKPRHEMYVPPHRNRC